jgi:hypothetical protein
MFMMVDPCPLHVIPLRRELRRIFPDRLFDDPPDRLAITWKNPTSGVL